MKYQRFLTPNFKPYNPLELAKETEKIVTRSGPEGVERKYTGVYSAPVYRGVATGYAVGCCLRCIYCWSNWSRDFPEIFGKFYSPKQVALMLQKAAKEGITASGWEAFRHLRVYKLRLSGCEPTIGREHLFSVLSYLMDSEYPLFILETNGILLGADKNYVKKLTEFAGKLYVRVSFKAATPEGFTQRTGALGKFYDLPFKALKYLLDEGIYARAAVMTDPKIMSKEERKLLIEMLGEIDPRIAKNPWELEEERIDAYETTVKRLKAYIDEKFAEKLMVKFSTNRILG
ncbi:molybdenum cofactor biosynthesis protein MoaA [Candidatus Bathyarchaeota archaeon]|nr:MAG: molybdenum cofactor biosynthesis protein MoaA [Candidatus Bathyarchaeota archaeon]